MILEAENVTKQYQTNPKKARFNYALSPTSLTLKEGELAILTGKSGSGKSTLLHILAGLLKPTSGLVSYNGISLYDMKDKELSLFRNKHVSVIPQGDSGIYSLTVEENVKLPHLIQETSSQNTLPELLRELEIDHLKDAYPSEMSGGELRRMSIARGLFQEAEVILADEPTSDLDDENTAIVIQMLRKAANNGKSVFIVTHEKELLPYADTHYTMKAGVMQKEE